MDLNHVVVSGSVEREPFVKELENGTLTTSFAIRVEEPSQTGEVFKLFVTVDCYGQLAKETETLQAGDAVVVSGKLKYKSWTGKNGEKKSTLAVLARTVLGLHP